MKFVVSAALFFALSAVVAWPQTTTVKGTVTQAGKPVPGVQVDMTRLDNGQKYHIKTQSDGSFMMMGVGVANYQIDVIGPNGEKVYSEKRTITPGEEGVALLAIDLSSGTGMTAEQRKAIEAQNAKAQNMNVLIKQAQDAMAQKNWQAAEQPLQQLVAADANQYQFYKALGDVEYNLGKFDAALESYQKGIQVAENTKPDSKKPATDPAKVKEALGAMLTQEGNTYIKLHKNPEASEAFKKAAASSPGGPAAYNLCVVNYNSGNAQDGIPACDHAIAADPKNANAYFLKGSLMMQQSKQGKDGKLEAPEGTAEALNKYLELEPDGPHANDAKQMLEYIGAKIQTTYKAGKKK
ncbi:MAG TPA: tetratricopeptide repeat protein [Terriglobales bacterium]|nr:tetratricopeptide repeat protein [Terriglobales bacterium]